MSLHEDDASRSLPNEASSSRHQSLHNTMQLGRHAGRYQATHGMVRYCMLEITLAPCNVLEYVPPEMQGKGGSDSVSNGRKHHKKVNDK